MPRSWFDFQIFIRVSNRIFLKFLFKFQVVQASNRLTIEGPLYLIVWGRLYCSTCAKSVHAYFRNSCVCVCVCVRERERESEREREKRSVCVLCVRACVCVCVCVCFFFVFFFLNWVHWTKLCKYIMHTHIYDIKKLSYWCSFIL